MSITNTGSVPAQLVSRHWIIIDSNNQVQEVRGAGVVGEQPVIEPGDTFQYTSGAALTTPSGIMAGHYEMITDAGESFVVEIPAFSLASPGHVQRPN